MIPIVTGHGYSIEEHFVHTEDGFILRMFRMPHGVQQQSSLRTKPVVFLQHALLDSSWAFVCNAPHESLGYILADQGYDVWFGNNRGNTYSRNHSTLSPSSAAFWNFTYDQMASQDLPAQLAYVLRQTQQPTLSYIGHSQGTIQAFAGFSDPRNAQIASKVNLFIAMAPVAFVHHQRGLLLNLLAELGTPKVLAMFGLKEFLGSPGDLRKVAPGFCHLVGPLCDHVIELIVGPSHNLNNTRMPVYVSETPAGTSVRNMDHWAQGIRKPVFQRYDFGSEAANMIAYNQSTPPPYKLADLKVPTALFSGSLDYLADPADVGLLVDQLPSSTLVAHVNTNTFAHLDYTWADNAFQEVYPQVLTLLQQYSSGNQTIVSTNE